MDWLSRPLPRILLPTTLRMKLRLLEQSRLLVTRPRLPCYWFLTAACPLPLHHLLSLSGVSGLQEGTALAGGGPAPLWLGEGLRAWGEETMPPGTDQSPRGNRAASASTASREDPQDQESQAGSPCSLRVTDTAAGFDSTVVAPSGSKYRAPLLSITPLAQPCVHSCPAPPPEVSNVSALSRRPRWTAPTGR